MTKSNWMVQRMVYQNHNPTKIWKEVLRMRLRPSANKC